MDAIETRLAKIESQVRFQRRITAFLIILLVAGISYGATAPIPEVIQARKFAVVNAAGREVVTINSWELGGEIKTYPAKGKYWASITLAHTDNGQGLLKVYNKDGKDLIYAGADQSGDGLLKVYNKDGKDLIYSGAGKLGDGILVVYNKDGKQLIYAGAGKSGNGLLEVSNKDGKDRVKISGGLTGGGGILVFNKTGEEVVQIYADDYGMGYVGAFDRKGKGRTLKPR